MCEENICKGWVDHEDLEKHECVDSCLAHVLIIIKLIVKEHSNILLWSDKKPIIVSKKCLKCTNRLSHQLCKGIQLDGDDLGETLQKYNLQLICAALVNSNDGSPTALKCHLVRSEDFTVNTRSNTSNHIIVFFDEVMVCISTVNI